MTSIVSNTHLNNNDNNNNNNNGIGSGTLNIPCQRVVGDANKCTTCDRFYGCDMFRTLCSGCYKKKNYDDWFEKVGKNCDQTRYYSDAFLNELVKNRMMPNDSNEFKALRKMFKNRSIYDKNTVVEFLFHLFENTPYKGISLKQAQILWLDFHEKGSEFVCKNPYSHLLCGMIIDWWNIDLNKGIDPIGGAACYYIGRGKEIKPIQNEFIRPPLIYVHYLLVGYCGGAGSGGAGSGGGYWTKNKDGCSVSNGIRKDLYNVLKSYYHFWVQNLAWNI